MDRQGGRRDENGGMDVSVSIQAWSRRWLAYLLAVFFPGRARASSSPCVSQPVPLLSSATHIWWWRWWWRRGPPAKSAGAHDERARDGLL
ncbi:hypothetical protein GGR56DRAFT_468641 [Xylariaceae sp. FL0804]|nr:hypothetical protein GGR56DRAFT_468641 [Xylariaceae sp. FL0804]